MKMLLDHVDCFYIKHSETSLVISSYFCMIQSQIIERYQKHD